MSDDDRPRPSGVNRRRFCQAAGASACALAAGGTGLFSLDFLHPRVLFEPPASFTLGPPEAVPVGSVITNEQFRVLVVRLADGFRALSSICPHLGCIARYQPDGNLIACPCHGSRFSLEGDVLSGPAPRPLRWLEMAVSEQGLIEVNTAVEVAPGSVFKF